MLELPQSADTPLTSCQQRGYACRYAFARSSEVLDRGGVGEDYLALEATDDSLSFVLCDGVGQSFYGNVAATHVGSRLLQWLLALDAGGLALGRDGVTQGLGSVLNALVDQVTAQVEAVELAAPDGSILRKVLEDKRSTIGSETMFACGRLDLPSDGCPDGRLVLASLGNLRVRAWHSGGQGTTATHAWPVGEPRDDEAPTWSSRHGVVGGSVAVHVQPLRGPDGQTVSRLLVYSDGLKAVDSVETVLANFGLANAVEEARGRDDVSVLEVWLPGGPDFLGVPAPAAPEITRAEVSGDVVLAEWVSTSLQRQFEVQLARRGRSRVFRVSELHWECGGTPPGDYTVRVRTMTALGAGPWSLPVHVQVAALPGLPDGAPGLGVEPLALPPRTQAPTAPAAESTSTMWEPDWQSTSEVSATAPASRRRSLLGQRRERRRWSVALAAVAALTVCGIVAVLVLQGSGGEGKPEDARSEATVPAGASEAAAVTSDEDAAETESAVSSTAEAGTASINEPVTRAPTATAEPPVGMPPSQVKLPALVERLAVSGSGEEVVALLSDGSLCWWSGGGSESCRPLDSVGKQMVVNDLDQVIVDTTDGGLLFVDASGERKVTGHGRPIRALAVSPDGRTVAVALTSGQVENTEAREQMASDALASAAAETDYPRRDTDCAEQVDRLWVRRGVVLAVQGQSICRWRSRAPSRLGRCPEGFRDPWDGLWWTPEQEHKPPRMWIAGVDRESAVLFNADFEEGMASAADVRWEARLPVERCSRILDVRDLLGSVVVVCSSALSQIDRAPPEFDDADPAFRLLRLPGATAAVVARSEDRGAVIAWWAADNVLRRDRFSW